MSVSFIVTLYNDKKMETKNMKECDKNARIATQDFVSSVTDCICVFCSFELTDPCSTQVLFSPTVLTL